MNFQKHGSSKGSRNNTNFNRLKRAKSYNNDSGLNSITNKLNG